MWSAILGTGIGAVQAGIGAYQQGQRQRKYDKWLDGQQTNLDKWYQKENSTQMLDTSEGQSAYQGLKRLLRDNSKRVDNSLVKTGGTAESALAQKQQTNNTLADGMSQISAQGTQRKSQLQNMYMQQNNYLRNMKANNMQASIEGSANMMANGGDTLAGGLANLFVK